MGHSQKNINKFQASSFKLQASSRGFTLIELLISVALIAILSVVSFLNLANYKRTQSVSSAANEIVATLRNAQNYSLSQESGGRWGVYFQNVEGGVFYSLFQGTAYTSASTTFQKALPSGLEFVLPVSDASSSVVFAPITGLPDSALTVKISLINNSSVSSTISVNTNGEIQY